MANSKYEYVKLFEVDDEVMLPNLIVVRVDGVDFRRFSEVHGFVKPNDEKALELMNCCAMATMEMFSDVIFSYGFNDEYRCSVSWLLCFLHPLSYLLASMLSLPNIISIIDAFFV